MSRPRTHSVRASLFVAVALLLPFALAAQCNPALQSATSWVVQTTETATISQTTSGITTQWNNKQTATLYLTGGLGGTWSNNRTDYSVSESEYQESVDNFNVETQTWVTGNGQTSVVGTNATGLSNQLTMFSFNGQCNFGLLVINALIPGGTYHLLETNLTTGVVLEDTTTPRSVSVDSPNDYWEVTGLVAADATSFSGQSSFTQNGFLYSITWIARPGTAPPTNSLQITTSSLPNGQASVAYDSGPLGAVGGAPFPLSCCSYEWSGSKLPPGLAVSFFTGRVYGVPAVPGPYFPVITVTDSQGATATKNFTIAVAAAPTKSRYTQVQKEYYSLLAQDLEKRAAALELVDKACTAGAILNPALEEACIITNDLSLIEGLLAYAYEAKAADPADPNYKVIAQPTPPAINLPSPPSTWNSSQLVLFNASKTVLQTQAELVGLARATITTVNRAEGAYEAGDSYWEQQQVAALNRYVELEAFEWQLLLAENSQLRSAYANSGFPNFTVTTNDASKFSLDIAANGLSSSLQQQLTSLGADSNTLAAITEAWSSFDPATISGDTLHALDLPTTDVQQVTASFITPFSGLAATVQSSGSTFELKSAFTLGTGNNGINPITEDVSFSIGSFAMTIPAGSFTLNSKGYYQFAGTVNGVNLQAIIKPTSTGYQLQVDGTGANLKAQVSNPVTTIVWVGNDGGLATATAQIQ